MPGRKKKRSRKEVLYTVGHRGYTVSIVRMPGLSNLYLRSWNAERKDYGYQSLRHSDLDAAKDAADHVSTALRKAQTPTGTPTLALVFARYEAERTPQVG